MRRIPWLACAFVCAIAPASASDMATTPVVQTRTTNVGQAIVVPAHPTVIVSQSTIPPGGRTPTHKHPYQRYVYVLDGTLTVVDETTGQTFEIKSGGFLAEMVNRWHHGENRGTTSVRLVAIDQVPEGTGGNMVMKPGQ